MSLKEAEQDLWSSDLLLLLVQPQSSKHGRRGEVRVEQHRGEHCMNNACLNLRVIVDGSSVFLGFEERLDGWAIR